MLSYTMHNWSCVAKDKAAVIHALSTIEGAPDHLPISRSNMTNTTFTTLYTCAYLFKQHDHDRRRIPPSTIRLTLGLGA